MGREEDMAAAHGAAVTLWVMDGRGRGPPTSRLAWMNGQSSRCPNRMGSSHCIYPGFSIMLA